MLVEDISYLELWQLVFLAEQTHLCNFGREEHEKHFCEAILNLNQWSRRRCHLNKMTTARRMPDEKKNGYEDGSHSN